MDRWDESQNNRLSAWFHRWSAVVRRWFGAPPPPGPPINVDALAQEVFARLHLDGDIEIDDPQAHLLRIADDVTNEWQESARRRPRAEPSPEDSLSDETRSAAVQELTRKRMQAALRSLPQRHREALLLHFKDGLTCKQIAQKQGRTYQAVLRDVTSGYSRLRHQLNLEEIETLAGLRKTPRKRPRPSR